MFNWLQEIVTDAAEKVQARPASRKSQFWEEKHQAMKQALEKQVIEINSNHQEFLKQYNRQIEYRLSDLRDLQSAVGEIVNLLESICQILKEKFDFEIDGIHNFYFYLLNSKLIFNLESLHANQVTLRNSENQYFRFKSYVGLTTLMILKICYQFMCLSSEQKQNLENLFQDQISNWENNPAGKEIQEWVGLLPEEYKALKSGEKKLSDFLSRKFQSNYDVFDLES